MQGKRPVGALDVLANFKAGDYFMGAVRGQADNGMFEFIPSRKHVTDLSQIVGLAPSVAFSFGSYNVAGVASLYSKNPVRISKGPNGEKVTVFMPITVWGAAADTVVKFTRKGALVGVVGRITQRKYTNRNGVEVTSTEVSANQVEFLEPKNARGQDDMGFAPDQPAPGPSNQAKAKEESKNLDGLRQYANVTAFSEELLQETKRVARKKIIIKAHFRDDVFERYGFEHLIRKNQKFHYGVIEI